MSGGKISFFFDYKEIIPSAPWNQKQKDILLAQSLSNGIEAVFVQPETASDTSKGSLFVQGFVSIWAQFWKNWPHKLHLRFEFLNNPSFTKQKKLYKTAKEPSTKVFEEQDWHQLLNRKFKNNAVFVIRYQFLHGEL